MQKNGATIAQFTFDADGKRVKSVMDGETILFVGAHFEIKNGNQITKYYMAGSTRIAMRKYTAPQPMTVEYMLSDHLGSTSLTTDANGAKVLELRYKAWGEIRATWTSSPSTTPVYKMPLYQYTGQAAYLDDPLTSGVTEGFGLMFYNARWYDPYITHFIQADNIIPPGTQGYDRFAYGYNNPLRYNDPTGHLPNPTIKVQSTYTFPISDRTNFVDHTLGASDRISAAMSIQKWASFGVALSGGTLITGGAAVLGFTKANIFGAVVGGAVGAYASVEIMGEARDWLLDQYQNDIDELAKMAAYVNSFNENEVGTFTVTTTIVTYDPVFSPTTGELSAGFSYEIITICSSTGECHDFNTSSCPSNQHAINSEIDEAAGERRGNPWHQEEKEN